MERNIILCGVGGQGILLAAKIIAEAAQNAGFQVTSNEIHGMAQRGGSVTASIRVGENLYSPLIPEGRADMIASLEAAEALRWRHWLSKDGLAVVSSQRIVPVTVSTGSAVYPDDIEARLKKVFPNLKYRDFPAEALTLGNGRLANTIMLGALSEGFPDITLDQWHQAVSRCVKPEFVNINLKAFDTGRDA